MDEERDIRHLQKGTGCIMVSQDTQSRGRSQSTQRSQVNWPKRKKSPELVGEGNKEPTLLYRTQQLFMEQCRQGAVYL